jgi:endonuclease/exonuclease/phosphatase family metal-dependent hydrolase
MTARSPAQELRARLRRACIPAAGEGNLRIATWNLREFGKTPRLDASIRILAATIASFDLVSIVELRDDLTDLHRLLKALGKYGPWRVVHSDYLRDAGGNRERVGFLYRADRVEFTGLASNAEATRTREGDEYEAPIPWWRAPFLASFSAGKFPFLLVAAHLRWGKTQAARETELRALGSWLQTRRKERFFGGENVLVVGDFNVANDGSKAWPALRENGLCQAPGLEGDPGTDLARGKRYDRILVTEDDQNRLTGRAGAVDLYAGSYEPLLPKTGMTEKRLTWEISDHLPLWVEILTG